MAQHLKGYVEVVFEELGAFYYCHCCYFYSETYFWIALCFIALCVVVFCVLCVCFFVIRCFFYLKLQILFFLWGVCAALISNCEIPFDVSFFMHATFFCFSNYAISQFVCLFIGVNLHILYVSCMTDALHPI